MKQFRTDLLDLLNEKELWIACKYSDMEFLLEPMKEDSKRYEKYTKKLGRLDKKSSLVKKMLPKIAYDLYLKGDERYCSALSYSLTGLKTEFELVCTKCTGINLPEITQYSKDELVNLYKVISDNFNDGLPFELYVVFLKIYGVVLCENEITDLEKDVSQIIKQKEVQSAYKRETEMLLKKQEKEILAQQEQEKERIIKERKKLSKENSELKCTIDKLNQQIMDYKQKENEKYTEIFDKWNSEAEKEYERKCRDQEQKLSQIYREKLAENNDKLRQENDKKKKQLEEEFKEIREKNIAEQKRLNDEIVVLENKKNALQDNMDLLHHSLIQEQEALKKYKDIEKEYFENIEKRIYEQKLDEVLVDRFQIGLHNKDNQNDNAFACSALEGVYAHEDELDRDGTIECNSVESLDDFENDLRDNISLFFENAMDISVTCIAALVCHKAIIVEKSISYIIAKCISSVTSANLPYCIRIHDAVSVDMVGIINKIKEERNKTILIDGVLNKYDEELFDAICSECKDKQLIFTVSDMEDLKLFSKTIYNCAIVLDIEKNYTYESSEELLIAQNDINKIIEINVSRCKVYYDRVFRNLVAKHVIGKKTSIDFSKLLYVYFTMIQSEQIGEVMRNAILKCCNLDVEQDVEKLLIKAGLKS